MLVKSLEPTSKPWKEMTKTRSHGSLVEEEGNFDARSEIAALKGEIQELKSLSTDVEEIRNLLNSWGAPPWMISQQEEHELADRRMAIEKGKVNSGDPIFSNLVTQTVPCPIFSMGMMTGSSNMGEVTGSMSQSAFFHRTE